MYEQLGVITKKEQSGASIFVDNKGNDSRIFGGAIGDIVVKDTETNTAVIFKSAAWDAYQNEHKKPKIERAKKEQEGQNV